MKIGGGDKKTFVLNGSGVASVCVELSENARFEVCNTFGAIVRSDEAKAGISRISVPLGGHVVF